MESDLADLRDDSELCLSGQLEPLGRRVPSAGNLQLRPGSE